MISPTIKWFIESRSLWDLLLILVAYSTGWFIYFRFGVVLFNIKVNSQATAEFSLYMGFFGLITKAYLESEIFSLLSFITLVFVFYRMSGASIIVSAVIALIVCGLTGMGELFALQPLFKIQSFHYFFQKTSLGITVGTLLEASFTCIAILIIKGVRLCRRQKNRKYFIK